MRRRASMVAAIVIASMTLSLSASAHAAPPCNDSGDPGNSDYARHHISALAKDGALGNDGHKPGSHRGFSVCLGVHG